MPVATLDRIRKTRRLGLDEGCYLFGDHALRFGLTARSAGGNPHQPERHHTLRFQAKQRRLRRQRKPRVPH